MKLFIVLLFSIYMAMATLAAPLLHVGDEIRVHSADNASMNMESRNAHASVPGMNDMLSRCLRAAMFFTTAIPSSPLALAVFAATLLLFAMLLRFHADAYGALWRWKFAPVGRPQPATILYLAFRSLRKWLALLELSPNRIAASTGR